MCVCVCVCVCVSLLCSSVEFVCVCVCIGAYYVSAVCLFVLVEKLKYGQCLLMMSSVTPAIKLSEKTQPKTIVLLHR